MDNLVDSMFILVDNNTVQAKELNKMREQINALHNNNPRANTIGPTRTVCPHYTPVGRNMPHAKDACFFNPKSIKNRPTWAKELMKVKGVAFEAGK